ncbi:leucyl aminopeptidase family protein [Salinicoccus sp. ID82-1]|uniref:leucyl aminopeptidase family protein n=1 Tax=Salinicoccus sp. ID82-1 TaxID=2820269 RepID=UPI001F1700FC|nr:leucyl aminopeptidase family protein [Salinicoccus sp. ID82-1]MCG1010092.1 leucyl aminopeptidase family protein [Salinicoccus sp. ID82-1]
MQFQFRDKYVATEEPIIIGLPHEPAQMDNYEEVDTLLNGQLDAIIKEDVLSTEFGVVTTTGAIIQRDYRKVIAVGLGDARALDRVKLSEALGVMFQFLKQTDTVKGQILLDTFPVDSHMAAELVAIMAEISVYEFNSYKVDQAPLFSETAAFSITSSVDIKETVSHYGKLGEGIIMARNFSETPPNLMTPEVMADKIAEIFESHPYVTGEVKDAATLEAEGYGLITAVGKASYAKPRLVTIEYRHPAAKGYKPVALVGKGVTYDTGGYSIKSKTGMPEMKYDMSGAANVIGMVHAASNMSLPVHIIGVVALAENMIDGNAMRPDDVYTSYSGQSVEVKNTDAEGRLVLGDAVFHASQYSPSLIMDFATLTGAVVAALGEERTGVFTNKDAAFLNPLIEMTEQTGEAVWQLPISEMEEKNVRQSAVADLTNHVEKPGRASFAACFIKQFANGTPWIHFDIAGTGTTSKTTPSGPKGATGVMIHTIVKMFETGHFHG